MSQINVEFIFEGKPIIIYCRESDKMKEVIKQFCIKSNVRRNSIYCLYSGNKIDENIKIKELIKSKNINEKISILVYLIDKENQEFPINCKAITSYLSKMWRNCFNVF